MVKHTTGGCMDSSKPIIERRGCRDGIFTPHKINFEEVCTLRTLKINALRSQLESQFINTKHVGLAFKGKPSQATFFCVIQRFWFKEGGLLVSPKSECRKCG
jgi:hypothetical protein